MKKFTGMTGKEVQQAGKAAQAELSHSQLRHRTPIGPKAVPICFGGEKVVPTNSPAKGGYHEKMPEFKINYGQDG